VARRQSPLDIDFADTADDPLASRRRSEVMQLGIGIVTGILIFGGGVGLFAAGINLLGGMFIAVAIVRAVSLVLERRGHHNATLIHIGSACLLYCAAIAELGPGAGVQFWAVPLMGVPSLVLGPQHQRLRPVIYGVTLATVVAGVLIARRFPPHTLLASDILSRVEMANLTLVIIFTTLVLRVYRRMLDRAERRFMQERAVSERLLANILPGPIAARLKRDEHPIADGFEEVSVLFADVVNFTEFSAHAAPEAVVTLLNRLFHAFDDMVERHGLEKIKTIGDAYMVAAGVPGHRDDHADAVADLAFEMLAFTDALSRESGQSVALRIGIHSGPLVAGVIGKHKFAYDVWGDTVNTAARMQTASDPGRVQVSAETAQRLASGWRIEPRGTMTLKGLGEVPCFFLLGRVGALSASPAASTP